MSNKNLTVPVKKCVLLFIILFLAVFIFSICTGSVSQLFAGNDNVNVLILGDSLSSGFGVEPEQAFPFLLQNMLSQKGLLSVKIINGSISGSTTAGALFRLKWFLKLKPDILILALGANDGLRGLSISLMSQNLSKTIAFAKKKDIKVILAGMKMPPNYGREYTIAFEEAFVSLAQKYDLPFIPFLLNKVAGKISLNQDDGIHPNAAGHKVIAALVFDILLEQL